MLNSNPLEFIYSNEDPATYLHYDGTRTTPDLPLASRDINEHTRRKITNDPASGHKAVIASKIIDDPGSGHKPVREIIDDPGSGHKPVTAQ
ncbi:unnamed protein product [Rodentolepis nana]|uniref:DUF2795 domain-containing protein n=1 Tax=Rodentolepis nana TaxID=102285 RepID=A0A0R3T9H7_RODNA|nr:unnamed protein product [Rodentolepis nana]